MSDTTNAPSRELDRRTNGGIGVRLIWNSDTDEVTVAVHDTLTGELFGLKVAPSDALFAFRHPYAYASLKGPGGLLAA
ncbi:MAG: hypothetical protein ACLPTJ_16380 [Solirubrobacteraceae bacterium]